MNENTLEELVMEAMRARAAAEEYSAMEKVIKDEIRERLIAMKVTGTKVGSVFVSRIKRLNTSEVSISDARELGCTEQKEVKNLEMIKKLWAKGTKIKGVKMDEFISLKEDK